MARPAKYTEEDMLDAAAMLCMAGGVEAVTASAIARTIKAPSGSVYHRFEGRMSIRAALWMRTVERFQSLFLDHLRQPESPVDAAVSGALFTIQWCRDFPSEARILLHHRREEFLGAGIPGEYRRRAQVLERAFRKEMKRLACVLDPEAPDVERVQLAATGIPLAVLRPYIQSGKPPPARTFNLVENAIRAVLA